MPFYHLAYWWLHSNPKTWTRSSSWSASSAALRLLALDLRTIWDDLTNPIPCDEASPESLVDLLEWYCSIAGLHGADVTASLILSKASSCSWAQFHCTSLSVRYLIGRRGAWGRQPPGKIVWPPGKIRFLRKIHTSLKYVRYIFVIFLLIFGWCTPTDSILHLFFWILHTVFINFWFH